MTEYIIPPMTDAGPVTKIEQGENGYKATIGYTAQAIDEMVRRVNEKLDEEMMARLAEQHGYVLVVRCRDCANYYEAEEYHPNGNYDRRCCKYFGTYDDEVSPDGFCAWAVKRKEDGE